MAKSVVLTAVILFAETVIGVDKLTNLFPLVASVVIEFIDPAVEIPSTVIVDPALKLV